MPGPVEGIVSSCEPRKADIKLLIEKLGWNNTPRVINPERWAQSLQRCMVIFLPLTILSICTVA
jgi:hypothetical protein